MAVHDTIVEIGALDGACGDNTFKKGFAALGFNLGVSNDGPKGTLGKALFQDLSVQLVMSKSNAQLAEQVALRKLVPDVKLHSRTGAGTPKEFTTIVLKDCMITSYNASGGGGVQNDSISIAYNEISYKSGSVDDKGNVTQGNEFKFNVAKNST